VKPRDDFTNGGLLPRVWKTSHTNLIRHLFQVHAKALAVTNAII
jgi:hypothetical protein